jgi:hypothetical protein
MALAHKELACVTKPVGFTEIPHILGGGQERVPVIVDGGPITKAMPSTAAIVGPPYRRPS